MLTKIKGVVGAFILGSGCLFGALFLLVPLCPLAFWRKTHGIYRFYNDFIFSTWLTFAIAIIRLFHGVEIITHGDWILPIDKAIVTLNHRTRLDWLYFWSTAITDGFLLDLKIVLKRSLARAPGAGWAMQLASFLFLKRRAEVDLPRIEHHLKYLSQFKSRAFKLLLFPEGTDYCPNGKKKSDEFADKNGLPRYEFVLHPRTTGVDFAFKTLRSHQYLDAIYDVTVAYDGPFPCSELAVVTGDLPKRVRFFVKRYPADVVEKAGPKFWSEIWEEKEKFLEAYYSGDINPENGRCEGQLANLVEVISIVVWLFFLLYTFIVILPTYWFYVLILTVGMFYWSEFTSNSIDGSIVLAGSDE